MNIEITETKTKKPKLTISSTGRIALKFHQQSTEEQRAPYIKYAKLLAAKIKKPEFTLRGKFFNGQILLRSKNQSLYFELAEL